MGDLMLLSAGYTVHDIERMGAAYRGTVLTVLDERAKMQAEAAEEQRKEMDARARAHGG